MVRTLKNVCTVRTPFYARLLLLIPFYIPYSGLSLPLFSAFCDTLFLSSSFLYYSFVSCLSFSLRSYFFALLPRTTLYFLSFLWLRFSKNFREYTY